MLRLVACALAAGALAACALAGAGCGGRHWSLPLDALDRIPLSITATANDDVWAVGGALGSGGNALVLHYDGSAWHTIDVGTDATLWWVDVAAPGSVWAVGERGTVLFGSDAGFAPVAVPATRTLYGVWTAPGGDVWVVGGDPDVSGVVLRQDATGWHDLTPAGTTAALFKVWGSADDDVFICGQNGAMLHWDGQALAPQPTGVTRAPLFTVAGRARDDVWAVGGLGSASVLHYDGAKWSAVDDPLFADAPGLTGVSVDADGTAWLVGGSGAKFHGHLGAFEDDTAFATREDLHAVHVRDGEAFAVGGNYQAPAPAPRHGVVAHFGGDVSSTLR